MPGCAAIGCSNSAKKGFLLKHFPRDPLRRKQWWIKMKRDNWKPTDHSCLCEVHFASEMWEKTRVDGKRALKSSAVPTIFSFSQPVKVRKAPKMRKPISPKKPNILLDSEDIPHPEMINIESDLNIASISQATVPEDIPEMINMDSDLNIASTSQATLNQSSDTSKTRSDGNVTTSFAMESQGASSNKFAKLYFREKFKATKYKKLYRNWKKKYNTLKNRNLNTFEKQRTFLNNDQVSALDKKEKGKTTKLMKWSKETVVKALKLKFSCGSNGYEELLKQGFPLPSLRTLQRRLQNLKFDSGILYEVFESSIIC